MIKIYYTTPEREGVEQIRPMLSLGGYRASNTVPNDEFGNLFGEITKLSVDKNKDEYRALVLKNEGSDPLVNVKLWFTYPEKSYSKFLIAAVQMSADENNELVMEHVNTIYSRPMYAEFFEANGEIDAVTIGNMSVGAQVGIWLKRVLNIDVITEDQNSNLQYDEQTKLYKEIPLETSETIGLVIDWQD